TAFVVPAYPDNSPGTSFRLSRNTVVSVECIYTDGLGDELADRLQENGGKPVIPTLIDVEENIWQTVGVLSVNCGTSKKYPKGLPVEQQRRDIPKVMRWRERGNVYGLAEAPFLNLRAPATGLLKDLDEWNSFWGIKDAGSVLGKVRLRGD